MRAPIAPSVPFTPGRLPFFYGWVVVGAATLGVLFSIPGQTMGVSVFTDALLDALGLSRLGFSNAYLLGTLGSAALLPRAGVLVDRVGVRVTAMVAAVSLGGVVAVLSQADRLAHAAAGTMGTPVPVTAFALLTVLFLSLRFSGQGVLTLVSRTMLARWFDRRRGIATAVSGLFVAFGFAYAPRLLDAWIARAGWRGAWLEIAVVEVVGMSLLAFVFFREDPESCGLTLDGASAKAEDSSATPEAAATRAEALRTRAFWVLTLTLALQGMAITGFTLHIVDIGVENGLGREAAVRVFVPLAVVSTITGAVVGWLADRVAIRALILSMLAAETVGFAASGYFGHPLGYALTALGVGLASGHFSVLTTVGLPRFFGRLHLGTITGASMTAVVVGSAIGPSALALSRAWLGSYRPGLLLAGVLPLVVALGAITPIHPRDRGARRR